MVLAQGKNSNNVDPGITPIFVLGTARSGTTWLANLLASHHQIAAVTGDVHFGIHESHLFSHTRYCFPEKVTCKAFFDRYSAEDYYKLAGVEWKDLCANDTKSETVIYWFRRLMEAKAVGEGKDHWLEKTPKHCMYSRNILAGFPDAKFVIIERAFKSTMQSNLTKYARARKSRWLQIAEKAFRYESDRKALIWLKRQRTRCIVGVKYEDLRMDQAAEVGRIERELGIDLAPLRSQFQQDSSYKSNEKYPMNRADWTFAYAVKWAVALMPLHLIYRLRKRRDMPGAEIFPKYTRLK
jgi:hypothetical protein